jgi:dihydropteroate synthase
LHQLAVYGPDVTADIIGELSVARAHAIAAGIVSEALMLDPGLGFSKTTSHSLTVLAELRRLTDLGHPVLIGASRKRFIGELTGVSEPSKRVIGSLAAHLAAVERGARVIRTHDVASTREALAVLAAIRSPRHAQES